MTTGIVLFPNQRAINLVDDVVAQASRAYDLGVRQVWLGQQHDLDAIALAALVGSAVPGLGVGTSVVPINPRHPLIVASLAQTAQAASHGNFSLGLGLGAHAPERQAFGTSWPNTITRLREHLMVLRSIFDTGAVDLSVNEISAQPGWPVQVAGGRARPGIRGRDGPKGIAGHLRAGRWHSAKSRRSSDHRRVHRTGRLEFGRRRRTAETQDHRTGARNPVRQR